MILTRLAIDRLPGIDRRFGIEPAGSGMQVIFGPNGIGKSSICRAVEGLYWDDRGSSRQTRTSCTFESDGESWHGEREGSTVRWRRGDDANALPNFPASHHYRCFFLQLRDLVDPSRDGTEDIASAIRKQMAGGFDLHEVRAALFSPVSRNRKRRARNSYNAASKKVQNAEGEHHTLERRVDRLDDLRSELDRARAAADRLVYVDRALGLARRRAELAEIRRLIGAMPESLAKLTGKESKDIDRLRARSAELEQRAGKLDTELNDARAARRDSGLAAPLDEADLAAWRDRADRLDRIEFERDGARTERDAARNELIAALGVVGGDLVDKAALTLHDHAELFEFLRATHGNEIRVGSIRERLRLLERIDPAGADQEDLDKLRSGIEALRAWLREPQRGSLADRYRARRLWLLAAATMLFGGVLLAEHVAASLVLLAAFGAGIAFAALLVGQGRDPGGRRSSARTRFAELNVEGPATWDDDGVRSRLLRLESRASELAANIQLARDHDLERQRLDTELDDLRAKQPELDSRRRELATRLGLEELPADAELVDFARALDGLRLACGRYEAVTGKLGQLGSRHVDRVKELADFLEHRGEPRPADAAAAKAGLNSLARRNARLKQALADEQHAQRQLEQCVADREMTQDAINRIHTNAGLDDDDNRGLVSLLDALPRYHELTRQVTELENQNKPDLSALEQAGESGLAEMDAQGLELVRTELTRVAAQEDSLRTQISETTVRMEQIRQGSDLQVLIAVREDTRASLRDLRDVALSAAAGDFLMNEVEQEFEATRMPRVFERAREHFSTFTFHNYELCLDRSSAIARLFAVDSSAQERRELDELSDGTRAQLLLAARIAFAEEVEQGSVLPLFLDEALDQSDPDRFEAIVGSLGCLARDQGRQIFYLTSDPLDVERIRAALDRVECKPADPIDLGLVRSGLASVGKPDDIEISPPPTAPQPGGRSPEEYAVALGVPVFDPARGYAGQHVFYVLWDDTTLLHDFLTKGLTRAGQWKIISATPLADRLGSGPISATEIQLRIDLLEVFCELWKQGRGRPVDADALRDSRIRHSRFFEDVVAIAGELDGNARSLLAMLEERADPRLKGLLSRNAEALRSYLTEHEYLDERPILDEDELRLRALSSPAANELADGVANECLHRWWQWAPKTATPTLDLNPN